MNGVPVKSYAYRDSARQAQVRAMLDQIRSDPDAGWLLTDTFDEPYTPEPEPDVRPQARRAAERRRERLAILASMRLNDTSDGVPPPGALTAQEAAKRLGVNKRTIERYKRDLREMAGAS